MKKLSVITIILLILCGCAGNGNIEDTTLPVESDDMSEVTDEVTPGFVDDLNAEPHSLASDYILSDADSYKIYLGEYLFAYITTDNRVFYVTDHGSGAVDSGYFPGVLNANAIFGNVWLVFVLDDTGTVSVFNGPDGESIELSEEMIGPFYDELSIYNGHIEDMYYASSDCWAIRSDGKWICSPALGWADWSQIVQIADSGSAFMPQISLGGDGRFLFTEDEVNESIVRWLGRNEYPCSMLAACYMTDDMLDIINADNMIKPENVTELNYGDDNWDIASFEKSNDVITYTGDFDGDGVEDTLTVDYSAMVNDTQGIGNIYVTSAGGTEYWRDMFALPSAEWTSFYVTEIDGRSYVIRYYPPMSMQGLLYYTCQIFTFDTDGNIVYYDEFGGTSVDGVNEFSDKAGKYLSNAVHLVSTFDGELITY